jgi:ATP-binding cassette, subfamily B, bacterial MsbA
MKSHIIWTIFLRNRKKNGFLAGCMVFFNVLAGVLEGTSFTLLLASLVFLTGEKNSFVWTKFLPAKGNLFLFLLLGALALQILRSFALYLGQMMTTLLTINIQKEAQKQIFDRIFHMSFPDVAELKKGDLMHHATAPPSFIPMLLDEYNRLFVSALMIASYLLIMMTIASSLTCIVLSLFALAALVQRYLLAKISKASQIHADHIALLGKQTAQSLEGLKTVHLFQRQEYTLSIMEGILDLISNATKRLKKLNVLIPSINESLGVLLVGLSLLLGSFFLQKEGVPYASYLFTYLTLTYRLGNRLQHLMVAKGLIAYYSGPLQRLKEMLSKKIECSEQKKESTIPFEQTLSFESVSFMFPNKHAYALKNVSLDIPKKQVVALVGGSGSGKSSLIDLLLRLYTPTQGAITIDGTPIDSFSLMSWRNLFGVVPQDAFLFNESIEENIRFGNLQASSTEILRAAKLAGADTFIESLPAGYQTIVGERGYRLSGGEKQRISLAQALVRNPEILILDEATSHLDSHSEQIVQETLARLRKEKTLLIVAHRLSTIQLADLIYVIENGVIIEKGSHQNLLQLGGRYHLFWHLQTTSNREDDASAKIFR